MTESTKDKGGRRPVDASLQPGEHTPVHGVRVPDHDWADWLQAADVEGLTISHWLRHHANRAAARVLRPFRG